MTGSSAPPPGSSTGDDPDRLATTGRRRLSDADRRSILDRAVTKYAQHGYSVVSNTGRQAVVSKRQRVNVPVNALLALLTGGLWLVVLALRLLNRPVDRVVLTVDDSGDLRGEFS